MARIRRCAPCLANGKRAEAIWAWQPDVGAFYTLGSHLRGFEVIPVCEDCRAAIKAEG